MEKTGLDFYYSTFAGKEKFVKWKMQLSDRWHQLILDMIKLIDLNFSPDETTILEVGCGMGNLCIWASKKSKNVTGLDIAKPGLRAGNILRKRFKSDVGFVAGDARYLPFRDGYYDIVICVETLEHIPNYREAFDELVRVTKKSGHIIVTVPNYISINLLYTPSDMLWCLIGRRLELQSNALKDLNRFNIFVINKLFERKDLRVIIRRGVGLIHIRSKSERIKSLERRLSKSFDKLKFLCLNIGVIAQKIK